MCGQLLRTEPGPNKCSPLDHISSPSVPVLNLLGFLAERPPHHLCATRPFEAQALSPPCKGPGDSTPADGLGTHAGPGRSRSGGCKAAGRPKPFTLVFPVQKKGSQEPGDNKVLQGRAMSGHLCREGLVQLEGHWRAPSRSSVTRQRSLACAGLGPEGMCLAGLETRTKVATGWVGPDGGCGWGVAWGTEGGCCRGQHHLSCTVQLRQGENPESPQPTHCRPPQRSTHVSTLPRGERNTAASIGLRPTSSDQCL
jgi:hypothetical protein